MSSKAPLADPQSTPEDDQDFPAMEALQRDLESLGRNDANDPLNYVFYPPKPTALQQQQQQQQQQHQQQHHQQQLRQLQPPPQRPPHAKQQQRSAWALSLPPSVIERNDFARAAHFIRQCKGQDGNAAVEFVRGVIGALTGQGMGGPGPALAPMTAEELATAQLLNEQSLLLQAQRMGIPPRAPPVVPFVGLGDELDQRQTTLVILIPASSQIVGHVIGKGGHEVGRIEREMQVTIKIEGPAKQAQVERNVCIIGSVFAATLAQQFVSHKVHEKLLTEGVQAEVLKMVVPNEIVRHLIGKSGANINRVQHESGARIQVEPESSMMSGALGRTIIFQGAARSRTFAQYLILRQIAEDRNVHVEWPARSGNGGAGAPAAGAGTSWGSAAAFVPLHSQPQSSAPQQAFMSLVAGLARGSNPALVIHEEALGVKIRSLGLENASVAAQIESVGNLLAELGRTSEALEFHKQALRVFVALHGKEHPDVARAEKNVARCMAAAAANEAHANAAARTAGRD